jgi:nucleoprotein TPR
VVAHAEAIKAVEELKEKYASMQAAARENQAAAETAQAKLASSEGSFSSQRTHLEKELERVGARCADLVEQNKVLHGHLESVSSQAAKIRQAAAADVDAPAADGEDAKLAELRQVIAFLRREKDIVDMQLVLARQENDRLRAQVSDLARDVEEARATLGEERESAVAAAATDAQHAELVDKIGQLTVLRESNATLRADAEAHAKRARELATRVKALTAELEPVRTQVRTLQAEAQASATHVKRLESENQRWQERNMQLLSKYDRIDPAEVQALRDELETLRVEKAAWVASAETQSTDQEKKVCTHPHLISISCKFGLIGARADHGARREGPEL